jgi:hypothetical protein
MNQALRGTPEQSLPMADIPDPVVKPDPTSKPDPSNTGTGTATPPATPRGTTPPATPRGATPPATPRGATPRGTIPPDPED